MIRFEAPDQLAFLALIPVMILFLVWRNWARNNAVRRIGDPDLIRMLMRRVSPFRRRLKETLWLSALICIILALARPIWGEEIIRIRNQGAQIIFALDVSLSMNAQDLLPSRLERAKIDLRTAIEALKGNEVGLVLFAREAFTYMPLTSDAAVAQVFLDSVQADAISAQGTAIARAIERALNSFDLQSAAPRIIILFSDGEDHEGFLEPVLMRAVSEGVTIHTVAYGTTQGAVIPIRNASGQVIDYKTDASGALVETRMNAALLRQIAARSGGEHLVVDQSAGGIETLLRTLEAVKPGDLSERVQRVPVQRGSWFAGLGVAFLLFSALISDAGRRENF